MLQPNAKTQEKNFAFNMAIVIMQQPIVLIYEKYYAFIMAIVFMQQPILIHKKWILLLIWP